tara:strand:- start:305 stop:568 length:264 start_codon:yes stop_codon:yes gene_type:complete
MSLKLNYKEVELIRDATSSLIDDLNKEVVTITADKLALEKDNLDLKNKIFIQGKEILRLESLIEGFASEFGYKLELDDDNNIIEINN